MNIDIIAVGKIKEKYLTDALNEYQKRLSRFVKLSVIEIPDERIPDNPSAKEAERVLQKEGERILAKLKDSFVIAMCIEGKLLDSPEIAELIQKTFISKSRITIIIGGSLGLDATVKARADFKLSLGRITLPHQLMRVVLSEQLYRACKIINNESYHK